MSRLSEITEEQRQRARRHAVKAQTASLPFMRYSEGVFWFSGQNATGSAWIAAADRTAAVWVLFHDKTAEEVARVYALDADVPPRPDILTDKVLWSKDTKGRANDPLGFQYEIPLINIDDGQVVVFKASTIATKAIIGRLLEDFANTARRPFVTVVVEPDPNNPNVMVPDLRIDGHSDNDDDIALPAATAAGRKPYEDKTVKPAPVDDMADDIPF